VNRSPVSCHTNLPERDCVHRTSRSAGCGEATDEPPREDARLYGAWKCYRPVNYKDATMLALKGRAGSPLPAASLTRMRSVLPRRRVEDNAPDQLRLDTCLGVRGQVQRDPALGEA
jgi:hypothetical protein